MDTIAADAGSNILDAIHYAVGTDIGLCREENQDSYGVVESQNFKAFMVADGMGGAQGGATASSLAVESVKESLKHKTELNAQSFIEAVYKSNQVIYEKALENPDLLGMGTTFVSLLFIDTSLHVIHVGDSRAYRIRDGKVTILTEDHTLVKELVKSGAISEAQAENHPISHMLTRSLGPSDETLVDCSLSLDGPVQGDVYLLCSDGLYNLVQDHEFVGLIQGVSIEEGIQKLIALANERGGADNITVLLVEIGEGYPVTLDDIGVYPASESQEIRELETEDKDKFAAQTEEAEPVDRHKAPQLKIVSTPPETKITSDERARRIDLLLEETSAILTRQKQEEKDRKIRRILLVVVLGILGIGLFVFKDTVEQSSKLKREIKPIEIVENNIATVPVKAEQERTQGQVSIYHTNFAVAPQLAGLELEMPSIHTFWYDQQTNAYPASDLNTAGSASDELLEVEKQHIRERKNSIKQQIESINAKLERFDKPITVEFMSYLKEAAEKTEALSKTSSKIRLELDIATRKLSVWFDRKKRLEVGDPVNMASEVAVSSESVRVKKESFEKVTWDYLKELETLRFNRQDAEQGKKVAGLLDRRNWAMKELTSEVKKTIEDNISASDQEIAELTQRRDGVEGEMAQISRETSFLRSIMNANPAEKEQLRAEIMRERNSAKAELDELKRILPDEKEGQDENGDLETQKIAQ